MIDDIMTELNTEEMTKAFYKAFPTVMTLEDAMRQALKAADEIERLRAELDHWKALAIHNDNLAQIQAGICPPIPHYEEKQ